MELQFPISKWLNPSNSVTFFPQVQDHLAEALGITEGIFPAHWKHHCHVMEASWGELWSCMWWKNNASLPLGLGLLQLSLLPYFKRFLVTLGTS